MKPSLSWLGSIAVLVVRVGFDPADQVATTGVPVTWYETPDFVFGNNPTQSYPGTDDPRVCTSGRTPVVNPRGMDADGPRIFELEDTLSIWSRLGKL